MSKPKAIVTRRWPSANEDRLREHFDVTFNESDVPFTEDQLKDALKNCDVFINNAHQGYIQVELLNAVFEMWKDNPDKTIVNISSLSKYPGLSGNQTGYSATS